MSEAIIANDGTQLELGNIQQAFGYDGSGNLTTITVQQNGNTYVQTFTYTGDNVTNISRFIKQ